MLYCTILRVYKKHTKSRMSAIDMFAIYFGLFSQCLCIILSVFTDFCRHCLPRQYCRCGGTNLPQQNHQRKLIVFIQQLLELII